MKNTFVEIVELCNSGRVDPRDRVSAACDTIESYSHLNALRFLLRDRAMQDAERLSKEIRAGKKFPLAGITLAVKDNIVTEGVETTAGSKILAGFRSPYTATAVKRLEEAGAIVVAKANLDEFAMGSSGENSAYGVTIHPFDSSRVPGGSSSGSAVFTAIDAVDGALGSETGGSVRQPASFCGVVGVKPTYGRISRYGLIAFASSLDQISPMAKNVSDAERLVYAMSGFDEHDATSAQAIVPEVNESETNIHGMRIAALKLGDVYRPQPAIENAYKSAMQALVDQGAIVEEIEIPSFAHAVDVYYIIATAEASSNLARYDGGRYGKRIIREGLRETYRATRGEGFGKEVKRRILLGTFVLSSGFIDAYYHKAMLVRRKMANEYLYAMKNYDALLLPTSPTTAFKLGERINDPVAMYLSDIYTIPANMTGCPAISIPYGIDDNKLPIGMQFMAKPFDEPRMFQAAKALERMVMP